ncbi:hypothetical protein [Mycolicibacterium sphagni]|uniref:Uncharacterized protein n=1 Tax=Mycolicibacterium sphagni TaxID=1786 RepID=A0A255E4D6_9MYCO|nr:hypothetical protein [Mycolicibacterium sphagni]OYN82953.1 hypothetical protein CG716_01790 [Mycolicibacterium sphagni]
MTGYCFVDIKTLGLGRNAPTWEFAAISTPNLSRSARGDEIRFAIEHDSDNWLESLPEPFASDYRARYDPSEAQTEQMAAYTISKITRRAFVVAREPAFHVDHVAALLRRHSIEPEWFCVEGIGSIVKGFLAARGELSDPPWNAADLSSAVGIDPADYEVHTAKGGVRWVKAQYDLVMAKRSQQLP